MVYCQRCGNLRPEESLPNGLCLLCWLTVPNPKLWKPEDEKTASSD